MGRLSVLKLVIHWNNYWKLTISATYRVHDLSKPEFIPELKNYLENCKNCKEHIFLGDFNIDLIKLHMLGKEHLNNLLAKGFKPRSYTITRPSVHKVSEGSCIDNIFIKTSSIEAKSFKY